MAYPTYNPDWAIEDTYVDGTTPNKIRPDEGIRDYGYSPNDTPTAQELNWQFNNLYQQIVELKSQLATPSQTPVNELKMIVGDNRNPAIIYGYGTWVAYAQGRTLIGAGTGTDVNGVQKSFSGGSTGGEYQHTQTVSEMPNHAHSGTIPIYTGGAGGLAGIDKNNNSAGSFNYATEGTGGGQAFNILNPYQVIYIWLRVS
jgi:hypothetical protein